MFAHIAGIPVEETLLMAGPSVATVGGVWVASVKARAAARRRTDAEPEAPSPAPPADP